MPSFAEYVAARWAALLRTAHLLTGDSSSAEDLLQATLVKAYVGWARVSRADAVDAYVRKMLLNEFLSQERKAARQRAVVVLRYYEDLTETEIAHVLGISAGTVKSQAHAALRTLRGRLDADPESEVTP